MNNIIKKLELDLGKKTITLNIEQAKKLKKALDELFGKQVVKEIHEHHDHYPYWAWHWYWHYTYTSYHSCNNDPNENILWCSDSPDSMLTSYNTNSQTMLLSLS